MSQQEIKNGAGHKDASGFDASDSAGNGAEIPRNEWTERFDGDKSAQDKPAQTGVKEEAGNGRSSGDSGKTIPLPKVDFSTFILSLASSALVQLGEVPNPETGKSEENLQLAKHTIDIISMLQEKTSNCLSQEEIRLMEGVLYELRMKYVIKSR